MMNSVMSPSIDIQNRKFTDKEIIPLFRQPQPKFVGKTKALFIGINYYGSNNQLRGCINDVINTSNFLKQMYNFPLKDEDCKILTDMKNNEGTELFPTRLNILKAMKWLVEDCVPGDHLFLHYSGHGGLKYNPDGTELTNFDETIYSVDFLQEGSIADDDLNKILVYGLHEGSVLTALFDSCHSGTILDLPLSFDRYGKIVKQNENIWQIIMNGARAVMNNNCKSPLTNISSQLASNVEGLVIALSASKDDQLSNDVCTIQFGCYGVMSKAFVDALKENPSLTYFQLLGRLQDMVKQYNQTPCLSTNRQVDLNVKFSL